MDKFLDWIWLLKCEFFGYLLFVKGKCKSKNFDLILNKFVLKFKYYLYVIYLREIESSI